MKRICNKIVENIILLILAFIVLIYRITNKMKMPIIVISLTIMIISCSGSFQFKDKIYTSDLYAFNEIPTIYIGDTNIDKSDIPPIQISIFPEAPLYSRGLNFRNIVNELNNNEEIELDTWESLIGEDIISTDTGELIRCDLPKDYGDYIDIATFKPYMDYRMITARGTAAYRVSHSDLAYTDNNGYRRYQLKDNEFTLNKDDYIIALGSSFTRGCDEGQRFLIVGENGMYTAKIGDHKSDSHTDSKNMYSWHGGGRYGGLIEFIIYTPTLEPSIKNTGSVNNSSVIELTGDILSIYKIIDTLD